jgi:hypothetical protein
VEGPQCDTNFRYLSFREGTGGTLISRGHKRSFGKQPTSNPNKRESYDDAGRVLGAIGERFAEEYANLLKDYRDLTEGVHMIRRATDRAFRAGVLPALDQATKTPLQECEAIARVIYRLVPTSDQRAMKKMRHVSAALLGNLNKDPRTITSKRPKRRPASQR